MEIGCVPRGSQVFKILATSQILVIVLEESQTGLGWGICMLTKVMYTISVLLSCRQGDAYAGG